MSENNEIQLSDGTFVKVSQKPLDAEASEEPADRFKLDKVFNAWGSSAGAGSDFFHVYRRHRANEIGRLKALDKEWDEKEEAEKFNELREKNIALNKERKAKSEARTQRRKALKKAARMKNKETKATDPKPTENPTQAEAEGHVPVESE